MEVCGQRAPRQFGDGARHLDAGRAATDHREGHQAAALLGIVLIFRTLERHQDAATQIGRVIERFQAGRVECPIVSAEIGVARTGREHEIIELHTASVGHDFPALEIDAGDFGQHHSGVALAAENVANGRRDIGRRKTRGRHLVEQRLKHMMIVAIDERDVERLTGEALGGRQSAEAAADNDHPRLG